MPFAGLENGQYEVVVLSTDPPAINELYRFAFGMPVATGVPVGDRWTWVLLVLGVLALASRQCSVIRVGAGGSRSVIASSSRQGRSSSWSGSSSQL